MKKKSEQLSLFNIIWIGFSFIAGITYTASFSTVLGKASVGNHIYWIFLIEGFIAYMCAWTFARLVQIHPEANGGGGQYVRTAFGKFWGLFMGMLNYAVIPAIGVNLLVSMVRLNFDDLAGIKEDGSFGIWGSFGSLYLDLIAFGLCCLATSIVFLGVKKYKIASTCIAYLTWIITLGLVIFGIIGATTNLKAGSKGLSEYATKITMSNFATTFTSMFFAFCGLETCITSGKNIKNRQKNVPISIIVIIVLATLFYSVFTLIVMLAVPASEGFEQNPNLQIFKSLNSSFLQTFGRIIVIICTILMRFNSTLQVSLFGGATLEPLAKQKFLPKAFAKENKEKIPVAGVLVNFIVFIIACVMFIFIPDIVQGFTKKPTPFDYATLASVGSILLIAIYMTILPVAIYHGIKKNMKVHIWEYIGWSITLLFLLFIVGVYFYGIGADYASLNVNGSLDIQKLFKCTFQLIYFVAVIVVSLLLYYVYHKKAINKLNESEKKELQEYEKSYVIVENQTK
ncbi:APC family permease [Spiroplasma tabanidicola]|uniref:Putative permease n=1 Tax=Spiroplasma tabanidicola TaxID=324079 RepID=A0A6I6C9I0_9MOLU|nr:APC family permease [Spiroplasma tabanidicola]QGS52246.1 putative permease [Spiroplasma tabanidicola]